MKVSSSSRIKSSWVTIGIFVVLAHFNPEVLTGSTPMERYFTFTNFLGMLFYGLQVCILADLMVRYRLKWTTMFLLGLIYGIFEEGFAVQTMLSPTPPGFVGVFRIAGLNVTWAIYIALFHTVVSVISSIIVVKFIWPDRVSQPFLSRRHYAVMLPVLAVIYSLFILFESRLANPQPIAVVILALVCLALGVTAWRVQLHGVGSAVTTTSRRYAGWSLTLLVVSQLFPFIVGAGSLPGFDSFATLLVIVGCFSFALLFNRLDRDNQIDWMKMYSIFVVTVGFWLVLGTFFRTPLSNAVAFIGVALEFYFALRQGKRDIPKPQASEVIE